MDGGGSEAEPLWSCGRVWGIHGCDRKVEYLDIKQILSGRSIQEFFKTLFVWKHTKSSWLRFRDSTASSSATSLATMQHGHTQLQRMNAWSRVQVGAYVESVVRQMLDSERDVFYYNVVQNKLCAASHDVTHAEAK